ncbi:hypothetical protein [Methylosinus sp. RM1]|uniref:hypothetical protein n=1 Tax=Methylosinus sp. RM1 TaxID=2583817 RepID=UPI001409BBE2|nr:hypothetical protein [Methylosinus sp. RM1]
MMHVLAPIGIAMIFILAIVLNKNIRDEPGATITDFVRRITLRKALRIVAVVILTFAFIYTLPIDLAILYALDLMVYFEAFAAVSLLAAQGRAQSIWYLTHKIYEYLQRAVTGLRVISVQKGASFYRYGNRARRWKRFITVSMKSDEDPDPGCADLLPI